MTAPEAVLLDAGGVLLLPNPWAVAAVIRAAGGSIEPATVRRAHYAATAAMDARKDRDWARYNNVLARVGGIPEARLPDFLVAINDLYTAPAGTLWNAVPDGVIEQLEALAATGVGIAVVSNSDGSVESVLQKCGISFDVVIDSTVVGYAKPEPEIFGFALDKLNVAPADAVHVGDTAWADVDGAHAAGIRPLHFDPFGDCPYPVGHHEHVTSLAEVVTMSGG